MTPQEEILKLEAENAAMLVKTNAVGIVGSIAGLYLANRQQKNTWGKIGYFFGGGYVARLSMALLYTTKLANNLARIQQLKIQYNL